MQVFIKIIATDKQTMREKCNSSSISYSWNNVLILLAWNVASWKFPHQASTSRSFGYWEHPGKRNWTKFCLFNSHYLGSKKNIFLFKKYVLNLTPKQHRPYFILIKKNSLFLSPPQVSQQANINTYD